MSIKNCVYHRRKVGDKILLIVELRHQANEDLNHEFQILQDGTFRLIYSFTGSYAKCLVKYGDFITEFTPPKKRASIQKPDLTEYRGKRIECGGFVQGKLSLGV